MVLTKDATVPAYLLPSLPATTGQRLATTYFISPRVAALKKAPASTSSGLEPRPPSATAREDRSRRTPVSPRAPRTARGDPVALVNRAASLETILRQKACIPIKQNDRGLAGQRFSVLEHAGDFISTEEESVSSTHRTLVEALQGDEENLAGFRSTMMRLESEMTTAKGELDLTKKEIQQISERLEAESDTAEKVAQDCEGLLLELAAIERTVEKKNESFAPLQAATKVLEERRRKAEDVCSGIQAQIDVRQSQISASEEIKQTLEALVAERDEELGKIDASIVDIQKRQNQKEIECGALGKRLAKAQADLQAQAHAARRRKKGHKKK